MIYIHVCYWESLKHQCSAQAVSACRDDNPRRNLTEMLHVLGDQTGTKLKPYRPIGFRRFERVSACVYRPTQTICTCTYHLVCANHNFYYFTCECTRTLKDRIV